MINFCLHKVRVVPIFCCLATRNNVHTQVSWSAGKLMCISHLHKLKDLAVCMTLCRLGIAVLWNTWGILDFSWGGFWNSYICIVRYLRMGSKFKPISYFIYILFKEPGGHFTQIFFFKYQLVMETHLRLGRNSHQANTSLCLEAFSVFRFTN